MRYFHLLSMMATTPWAVERSYLAAAMSILANRSFDLAGPVEPISEDAKLSQRRTDQARKSGGSVAVLPIYGVMAQRMTAMEEQCAGGVSVEKVSAAFRALVADDDISAIVLDWDSPGGSTYGVQEFADEVRAARGTKPIVSQVNSLMASAAYWVGSAADEIVVTPGGRAGSIGVYSIHEDISAMLEQQGVKTTIIKEGEHKIAAHPFGPLTKEGREQLESLVGESAYAFRGAVAENRKVSRKTVVESFGDGKVFGADELVKRGMADRVGTLGDTLARLGIPQPKKAAAAQARATFANGEIPAIGVLHDGLRGTLGLSKSQADALLQRGFAGIAAGTLPEANVTENLPAPVRLRSRFIPTA
jgi:signal peptide peptidase SppA